MVSVTILAYLARFEVAVGLKQADRPAVKSLAAVDVRWRQAQ
jgi:hypothetical protein